MPKPLIMHMSSLATGEEWWELYDAAEAPNAVDFLVQRRREALDAADTIKCRGTTSRAAKTKARRLAEVALIDEALLRGEHRVVACPTQPGRYSIHPFANV